MSESRQPFWGSLLLSVTLGAILVAFVLSSTGCGAPGYIRADAIQGTMKRVIGRHQVYTQMDPALSDLQKRANMRDGELLDQLLDEALRAKEEDDGEAE